MSVLWMLIDIALILLLAFLIFGRPGSEKEEGKKGSGKVKAKKALTTVWAVIVFIASAIGLVFLTSLSLILDR